MDFEHSDQFTQRVELIIRNVTYVILNTFSSYIYHRKPIIIGKRLIKKQITYKISWWKYNCIKQAIIKRSILQYLKQSFEAIREQLQCDLEQIYIQTQSKKQQQIPLLNTNEVMINEQINQIGLNINEIEKSLDNKIDLLNNKVEKISINRHDLQEQIKSYDARMESQWQGLANVSDQFWLLKKQFEQLLIETPQQKKKYSLFT
ncbi:unnamed protein product [Paramecium pentaurelia]|uniref:Uncharacterized protein n=1 Tax=Paramecium pentaurelia TaxID=43138 RepID=A0A8S1XTM4_9CILI|nr:unnamed protein product [Paramecium pentaurelia]